MRFIPSIFVVLSMGCRTSSDDVDGQIEILQELVREQSTLHADQSETILALEERLATAEAELENVKAELEQWQEGSIEGQLLESSQNNSDRLDALEELDIATQTWVSEGYTTLDDFAQYQAEAADAALLLQQSISANEVLIGSNTTNIGSNTTLITDNAGSISSNAQSIVTNASSIATNGQSIQSLTGIVDGHTTQLTTAEGAISTNSDDIDALEVSVQENLDAIVVNEGAIQSNVDEIGINSIAIQGNVDALAVHDTDISTNQTDILGNATSIQDLSDVVGTNTTNIENNNTSIATNAENIVLIDDRVSVLEDDYVPDLDDLFSTVTVDGANIEIAGSLDVSNYIHGSTVRFRNCGSTYTCTPKQCLALCQANGERMATANEVLAFASSGNQRCAHMWMVDDENPNTVMTAYPMYYNRTTGGCGSLNSGDIPRLESVSRGVSWDSTTTRDCACSTMN